jgi:hypothetical protein
MSFVALKYRALQIHALEIRESDKWRGVSEEPSCKYQIFYFKFA